MKNENLAQDYFSRAQKRLKSLSVLYQEEAWADVVREAQEIVELALKGFLRTLRVEVPRVHDVSEILREQKNSAPPALRPHLDEFCRISHQMRRDRELAFYGSEDLTPSDFYTREDATTARDQAAFVIRKLSPIFS